MEYQGSFTSMADKPADVRVRKSALLVLRYGGKFCSRWKRVDK